MHRHIVGILAIILAVDAVGIVDSTRLAPRELIQAGFAVSAGSLAAQALRENFDAFAKGFRLRLGRALGVRLGDAVIAPPSALLGSTVVWTVHPQYDIALGAWDGGFHDLIECGEDVVGGSHDVTFAGTLRRPVFVRVEMQGQGVLLALPCAGMN